MGQMKGGPASNENTRDRPSFLRRKVARLETGHLDGGRFWPGSRSSVSAGQNARPRRSEVKGLTTTINIPVLLRDYAENVQRHGHGDVDIIVIDDRKSPPDTQALCQAINSR